MKSWAFILVAAVFIFSCGEEDKKTAPETPAPTGRVDSLNNLVDKNPDSAGLRMNLINTLDSLKQFDKAIAQTDSLIKKDSLNSELWFAKAQLQEDAKDTAGAIKSYMYSLKIYPSPEAQLSFANLLAESRNEKALVVCQNLQKMKLGRETDAFCNFIAAIYYSRTGKSKTALQLFDRAIIGNYTLMEAHMEKGFIFYEAKNYTAALSVFEKATTVNTMYADAWYWKAKCNEAMGNKSEAILNYQRSLTLDKQLKEAKQAIERLK